MTSEEQLFWELFNAPVEGDVEEVLKKYNLLQSPKNWRPYGGIDSNFGVVENQQASPIPALIEKITNSIDAILMRLCQEQGIDPRSENAPRSIEEAIERFYPDHKNWDIRQARREQAKSLQILADGPRGETSLVIFDEGEGQTPEKFEKTFLSLLQGNKNDIHLEGDKLNSIYINMDSNALLSYRSKLTKSEAIDVANKRYVSAVYFHTLFLYTITRNRRYGIVQQDSGKNDEPVDISNYISDIFGYYYAQFLLNFDTQELIASLEM